MHDPLLFTAGNLFTLDYLVEGIAETDEYRAVDVAGLRSSLETVARAFPQSHHTNESQTEDDFIWPVLAVLGWSESLRQQNLTVIGREDVPDGLLFADVEAKAAANAEQEQWKRYAYGLAVIESKRWARPLDRATGRRDEAMAPSTQMLRYLRRIDDLTHGRLRWGILTNGAKWRLYWAGARSVSEEFLEIDLARALNLGDGADDLFASDADRDHWLRVFAAVFARTSFLPEGPANKSFHERARSEASFYEERVASNLSGLVFEQVFPSLAAAIAGAAPEAPLAQVRDAALVLLYRLLFLLYAEDRALLPVRNGGYDDYALRKLREEVAARISDGDAFSESATRIWGHIADLSRIIDGGDTSVGIPPYNGGLFAQDAAAGLLEKVRIGDAIMAPALDALSHERAGGGSARYINYRDLSVQQLGSIYERLLEFEIVRDDGALTIRPNPFARKSTGSYYTPEELVRLILDETLEPLIGERLEAFRTAIAALNPKDAEDYRRRVLREADPATAILSLRICDPAMGSGHFLVSLVDKLADHVLESMAEAATLAGELGYQSPLAAEIEKIRDTILTNAKAGGWAIEEAQLDDRHIVRRMVLKRCVYGVDKNPMAVELAKVALWLHTFTVGAPLSFIDHHLRAGDSLFGLWVRDAIEKAAARGGGELLYAQALREAQSAAAAMQVIERLVDVEIAEAHQSADTYFGVRSQVAPLDSFVSFIHAIDWLAPKRPVERAALQAWLAGTFGDPVLLARGKIEPTVKASRAADRMARQQRFDNDQLLEAFVDIHEGAQRLIEEEKFLNWQIAFPGVWDNWASAERHGGFDAVVGNPPWDRFEFEEVPWFEVRDRTIALEPSGAKRKARIRALRATEAPLWTEYRRASERLLTATRIARSTDLYSRLNIGKLNLYKLFAERAFQLVKPSGMVGMLMPSGIAGDLSSSLFFRSLATGGHLKSLYDFENRRPRYGLEHFFPDVDSRFKFCVLAAGVRRHFGETHCGFFLQAARETGDPERVFPMAAADFASVNPNTGTAPIFRSRRDMELTTAIYDRLPVLVNHSRDTPLAVWPVRYSQMMNITSDSHLFRTRAELEEQEGAWPAGGNRFQSAVGDWVPLYEGKMLQAFDHRAASVVVNPNNLNRPGQPLAARLEQSEDPAWYPEPQYWIAWENLPDEGRRPYVLCYKRIGSPTNARSMIAAIGPTAAYEVNANVIVLDDPENALGHSQLAANLNSVALDFVVRQKMQGQTLNWFIVEQLPVVPPANYGRMFGSKSAEEIVREAVLELTYTAHDMAPFARDMGYVDAKGKVRPPFVWDEDRRLRLRAKLDALYFILYGVFDPADLAKSRDDISYIFSTFPIVEREERARWDDRYRSRDLTLAWINALMADRPDADVEG